MPYRATPMPYRTQASAMVGDIKQPQTDPPPPRNPANLHTAAGRTKRPTTRRMNTQRTAMATYPHFTHTHLRYGPPYQHTTCSLIHIHNCSYAASGHHAYACPIGSIITPLCFSRYHANPTTRAACRVMEGPPRYSLPSNGGTCINPAPAEMGSCSEGGGRLYPAACQMGRP